MRDAFLEHVVPVAWEASWCSIACCFVLPWPGWLASGLPCRDRQVGATSRCYRPGELHPFSWFSGVASRIAISQRHLFHQSSNVDLTRCVLRPSEWCGFCPSQVLQHLALDRDPPCGGVSHVTFSCWINITTMPNSLYCSTAQRCVCVRCFHQPFGCTLLLLRVQFFYLPTPSQPWSP